MPTSWPASITDRATPSAALAPFPILGAEGSHTTHLSTIDADGNAVALTYTLEEGYGSKAVVAGRGLPAQQRDGRLQPDPRPHRHLGPDRHAGRT